MRKQGVRHSRSSTTNGTIPVITINSISTFFSPLADRLLHLERGVLAKVLPVAGCTGGSGLAERRFLAERFHIERIVTTHDPQRIAFSENTGIHECLLICRRVPSQNRPPTEFVSLRRMPTSAEEAVEAADAIVAGGTGDWGRVCSWPAERVQTGDWTPAQWYDGELSEIVCGLAENGSLVPAGSVLTIGATRQAAQDSWTRATPGEDLPEVWWVFDSVSVKIRHSMLGVPEQPVVPGGRRAHLHGRVRETSGNLMLATRYDTVAGALTALWTEVPTFGFGWLPARGPDRLYEHALCAWWNSTAGRLLLLNRRGKKLTYPKWSVEHIASLPCPKPGSSGSTMLAKAWQETCRTPLLPLRDATRCTVRRAIDRAAALVLDVKPEILADWRRMLAAEPTITNTRAVHEKRDS